MDDCIIMTQEGKDDLHQEITLEFFNVLRRNNLFLKPQKCAFEQDELDFLGLHVTPQRITISPDKIIAIKEWPCNICNVKELYQILGVLGYQWPFIANFTTLAKPLMNLLKNNTPFIWTEQCKKALDTLIDIVTMSPILCAPDPNQQFELEVDASQYALGAILWQRDPALP
jgi:RNase H-like domain found in reverse transcriptase